MAALLFRCAVWPYHSVRKRKPGCYSAKEGRPAIYFYRSEPKVCKKQEETPVRGSLPTWEEGQWFPLWVHWTGHFFGRAKARGGGRCSRIPSSAIRYWICPCEGHCCAGSPLLAACRGGRPSTGSMVGGISPSPGLAGGKSVAGMAAPTAAVSGNRAECESTASSFS